MLDLLRCANSPADSTYPLYPHLLHTFVYPSLLPHHPWKTVGENNCISVPRVYLQSQTRLDIFIKAGHSHLGL